jgi:hypothetical protein
MCQCALVNPYTVHQYLYKECRREKNCRQKDHPMVGAKIPLGSLVFDFDKTCTQLVSPLDLGSFLEPAISDHGRQSYGP